MDSSEDIEEEEVDVNLLVKSLKRKLSIEKVQKKQMMSLLEDKILSKEKSQLRRKTFDPSQLALALQNS
tara:strand:+ start:142 stop:348 length:207 start_codon:yes stop_codon:yes gene_type:complete